MFVYLVEHNLDILLFSWYLWAKNNRKLGKNWKGDISVRGAVRAKGCQNEV